MCCCLRLCCCSRSTYLSCVIGSCVGGGGEGFVDVCCCCWCMLLRCIVSSESPVSFGMFLVVSLINCLCVLMSILFLLYMLMYRFCICFACSRVTYNMLYVSGRCAGK